MDKILHKTKHGKVVELDPVYYGSKNEYGIFPEEGGGAFAMISFQRGHFKPNGCQVDGVLRVLIDKQQEHYDRYRAIQSLIDSLENMKREQPEGRKRK